MTGNTEEMLTDFKFGKPEMLACWLRAFFPQIDGHFPVWKYAILLRIEAKSQFLPTVIRNCLLLFNLTHITVKILNL